MNVIIYLKYGKKGNKVKPKSIKKVKNKNAKDLILKCIKYEKSIHL